MTTTELIDELKKSLGNRSDIANQRYVNWLNWAQYDLVGYHKKRLFPPPRFHILEEILHFQGSVVSALCGASVSASTFQLTGAGAVATADFYNDWVVKLTAYSGTAPSGLVDQVRTIVDYSGSPNYLATIGTDWSVNPDTSTTYSIYKRWYSLSDITSHKIMGIEKIVLIENETELDQKKWHEISHIAYRSNVGKPTRFAWRGSDLMFDYAVDDTYWFRMFYYRLPAAMAVDALDTEHELPTDWHEVVLQAAIWRGHDKLMEPDRASAAKNRYIELAVNKQDAFMLSEDHISHGLKVRR